MNKREFQMFKGRGNVFHDFVDPDSDLKQAKPVIAARIIAAFVFLLISSSVNATDCDAVPAIVQPSTLEVWAEGTRLLIPNRVMENYEREKDSWSYLSVYFFANYFRTGPSLQDKGKDTVYIPLVKGQVGKAERREVWMDIMNVINIRENSNVYVTIDDIHVVGINSNGEYLYVGSRVDN